MLSRWDLNPFIQQYTNCCTLFSSVQAENSRGDTAYLIFSVITPSNLFPPPCHAQPLFQQPASRCWTKGPGMISASRRKSCDRRVPSPSGSVSTGARLVREDSSIARATIVFFKTDVRIKLHAVIQSDEIYNVYAMNTIRESKKIARKHGTGKAFPQVQWPSGAGTVEGRSSYLKAGT